MTREERILKLALASAREICPITVLYTPKK